MKSFLQKIQICMQQNIPKINRRLSTKVNDRQTPLLFPILDSPISSTISRKLTSSGLVKFFLFSPQKLTFLTLLNGLVSLPKMHLILYFSSPLNLTNTSRQLFFFWKILFSMTKLSKLILLLIARIVIFYYCTICCS